MIAGIPFVLAGQLKTNTPHYIIYIASFYAITYKNITQTWWFSVGSILQ
jgi:hypothetical protein